MPLGVQLSGAINADDTAIHVPNIQQNGYGLGLSGKISKKIGNVEFSAGPFFRYWNIPDSNTYEYKGKIKVGGKVRDMLEVEPKNYTGEVGIKLRVSF
ncbi:hypothetical protein AGMMS49936_02750 [Endomicrobiia bacterium]|nr:hypothetical protein AGMMS49936_02750 [Endomicrobiia bacterium]